MVEERGWRKQLAGIDDAITLAPGFAARMRSLMGQESEELLKALVRPALNGLRVNTLKLSPEAFSALSPWPLEAVPWCKAGFIVSHDDTDHERPGKHPYHAAGLYYLQEPSAMAAAEALDVQPGQLVLDIAASPGGKATHLASLIAEHGLLVANEIEAHRTPALVQNLERWGTRRAVITNEEPARLAERWGPIFDRVLLDAPCSGEGMFRKSVAAVKAWSPETIRGCAIRQGKIIESAAALVHPSGLLLYSTCTFAPEENEAVIARFLAQRDEFELLPITLPGAGAGRPDWLPPQLSRPDLARAARFWPHLAPCEGHFMALLRRTAGTSVQLKPARLTPAPKRVRDLWRDFVSTTLHSDPFADDLLVAMGEQLFAVPDGLPRLDAIKLVRTGVWLGTLGGNRLKPAHSLALAMQGDQAFATLDLSPDDERMIHYLQGHPLAESGPSGWVLISVSGFPVGWGHRVQGVIKNAYPKGLRRL